LLKNTGHDGERMNLRISGFRKIIQSYKRMNSSQSVGLSDIGGILPSSITGAAKTELISWRSRIDMSIESSRSVFGGNFAQIATTDQEGHPRCRTVVFRGFIRVNDNREAMRMMTDARSEKVNSPKES
jgi:hypothetical protein